MYISQIYEIWYVWKYVLNSLLCTVCQGFVNVHLGYQYYGLQSHSLLHVVIINMYVNIQLLKRLLRLRNSVKIIEQ
jgi:hypothetical protein